MNPTNLRHSADVFFDEKDVHHTKESKTGYHIGAYTVYFKTKEGKLLIWDTIILPNRSSPLARKWGKYNKITYEIDYIDQLGNTHIKRVRFRRERNI